MLTTTTQRIILILALFVALVVVLTSPLKAHHRSFIAAPGAAPFSLDIFPYWCASELFRRGENPYDYELLLAEQRKYGSVSTGPVYFPPWNFILLAPVLSHDLATAIALMLAINIVLLAGATYLACKLLGADLCRGRFVWIALASATFLPALDVLNFGQTSLLVTVGLYGFMWCLHRRYDISAGLVLIFTLLKPHLGFLVWGAGCVGALRSRRWKTLLSFGIGISSLCALTVLSSPHIFSFFFNNPSTPLVWSPVSLVTPLRLLIGNATDVWAGWIAYILPIIAALGTTLWIARTPLTSHRWNQALSPLLCISALTSPYIWIFDHVTLLYVHLESVLLALRLTGYRRTGMLILIIAVQLLIFMFHFYDIADNRLFWYPLALLLIWSLLRLKARHDATLPAHREE